MYSRLSYPLSVITLPPITTSASFFAGILSTPYPYRTVYAFCIISNRYKDIIILI